MTVNWWKLRETVLKESIKVEKKSADLETTKKNNNRPDDGSLKLKQNNKYWISFRWVFSGGLLKRFFQAFQCSQSTFFLSFFYFYQRTSDQLVSPRVNWRSPLLIFLVMEPHSPPPPPPPLPPSLSYMLTKGWERNKETCFSYSAITCQSVKLQLYCIWE